MAQSRLEKIGTIFTRVTGLLKSGAMKPEDKPLWYEVYAAFPPKLEPKFDRPALNTPIRKIFYEEDTVRAHFHKINKGQENINLKDVKNKTQCQQYIEIYKNLKLQGALDDEKIKDVSYDVLRQNLNVAGIDKIVPDRSLENETISTEDSKNQIPSVNVKDIFKD